MLCHDRLIPGMDRYMANEKVSLWRQQSLQTRMNQSDEEDEEVEIVARRVFVGLKVTKEDREDALRSPSPPPPPPRYFSTKERNRLRELGEGILVPDIELRRARGLMDWRLFGEERIRVGIKELWDGLVDSIREEMLEARTKEEAWGVLETVEKGHTDIKNFLYREVIEELSRRRNGGEFSGLQFRGTSFRNVKRSYLYFIRGLGLDVNSELERQRRKGRVTGKGVCRALDLVGRYTDLHLRKIEN